MKFAAVAVVALAAATTGSAKEELVRRRDLDGSDGHKAISWQAGHFGDDTGRLGALANTPFVRGEDWGKYGPTDDGDDYYYDDDNYDDDYYDDDHYYYYGKKKGGKGPKSPSEKGGDKGSKSPKSTKGPGEKGTKSPKASKSPKSTKTPKPPSLRPPDMQPVNPPYSPPNSPPTKCPDIQFGCELDGSVDSCPSDASCKPACAPKYCLLPKDPHKIREYEGEHYVKLGSKCGQFEYVEGEAHGRHYVSVCCEPKIPTIGLELEYPYDAECSTCDDCRYPQKVNDACCLLAGIGVENNELGRDGEWYHSCDYGEVCCKCGPDPISYKCIPEDAPCDKLNCPVYPTTTTTPPETSTTPPTCKPTNEGCSDDSDCCSNSKDDPFSDGGFCGTGSNKCVGKTCGDTNTGTGKCIQRDDPFTDFACKNIDQDLCLDICKSTCGLQCPGGINKAVECRNGFASPNTMCQGQCCGCDCDNYCIPETTPEPPCTPVNEGPCTDNTECCTYNNETNSLELNPLEAKNGYCGMPNSMKCIGQPCGGAGKCVPEFRPDEPSKKFKCPDIDGDLCLDICTLKCKDCKFGVDEAASNETVQCLNTKSKGGNDECEGLCCGCDCGNGKGYCAAKPTTPKPLPATTAKPPPKTQTTTEVGLLPPIIPTTATVPEETTTEGAGLLPPLTTTTEQLCVDPTDTSELEGFCSKVNGEDGFPGLCCKRDGNYTCTWCDECDYPQLVNDECCADVNFRAGEGEPRLECTEEKPFCCKCGAWNETSSYTCAASATDCETCLPRCDSNGTEVIDLALEPDGLCAPFCENSCLALVNDQCGCDIRPAVIDNDTWETVQTLCAQTGPAGEAGLGFSACEDRDYCCTLIPNACNLVRNNTEVIAEGLCNRTIGFVPGEGER